jgi:lambda family phage minor tail protein L
MSIALQTVKLNHSAPVELYQLDITVFGGAVYRFSPQTNELGSAVVWQGQAYEPFPIQASGFEQRASGPFPRPTLAVSNVLGTLGLLIRQYDNLRGARLVRKRTMARYLDAANFAAGNPQADPLAEWPDEVWMIDECTGRNKLAISWGLRSPLDFDGVMLPTRVMRPNHCPWRYRSSDCGYTGGPVATVNDTPTSNPALDKCSQRLGGCKLRFPNQPLPFGGFPALGQLRQL